MKVIEVEVTDLMYEKMMYEGRKIEGRLWAESGYNGQFMFAPYNRKKERRQAHVLYHSAHGSLVETKQRLKIRLSVSKAIGKMRSADVMLRDSQELTDYLYELGKDEEIINRV